MYFPPSLLYRIALPYVTSVVSCSYYALGLRRCRSRSGRNPVLQGFTTSSAVVLVQGHEGLLYILTFALSCFFPFSLILRTLLSERGKARWWIMQRGFLASWDTGSRNDWEGKSKAVIHCRSASVSTKEKETGEEREEKRKKESKILELDNCTSRRN